jgi:hypothetical protein
MRGLTSSYVITSLVTAPASSQLTTLANVKDELDFIGTDTSNDARLTRFITEESDGIARYCNRVFGYAKWQDEFRPQRGVRGEGVRASTNPLKLSRWPLAVTVVQFTGNTYSTNLIDGLSTTTGLASGQLISGPGIPSGATIASVNVGAASLLLSTPATATAAAVSLNTGISVVETIANIVTGLTAGTDFEIDAGSLLPGDEGDSFLYRLDKGGNPRTWPATKIVVVYTAGYALPNDELPASIATAPSNLESACLRLVVWRFKAKGRDPMLRARNQGGEIGMEQYWVGSTPGNSSPYPNEIMSALTNFRTPVVA